MLNKSINTKYTLSIVSGFALSFLIIVLINAAYSTSLVIVFGQNSSILPDDFKKNMVDTKKGTIVLGKPFYTENTTSTNIRVTELEPFPMVDVSYKGNGTVLGVPSQTMGTIIDTMNADGTVHSKGKAIILLATGQVITYKSESIGQYNEDGSFSDKGFIIFTLPFHDSGDNGSRSLVNQTRSDIVEFDNVLGIYYKTVDPTGHGLTKVWKWG